MTDTLDVALRRVGRAAGPTWMAAAVGAVWSLARERAEFTADEVWSRLAAPSEPRALGAAFRRAQRMGIVRPTERFVPSKRAGRHHAPVRVWASQRTQPQSGRVA